MSELDLNELQIFSLFEIYSKPAKRVELLTSQSREKKEIRRLLIFFESKDLIKDQIRTEIEIKLELSVVVTLFGLFSENAEGGVLVEPVINQHKWVVIAHFYYFKRLTSLSLLLCAR